MGDELKNVIIIIELDGYRKSGYSVKMCTEKMLQKKISNEWI